LATRLAGRRHWTQHHAHDFGGKSGSVGLQLRHGLLFIRLNGGAGLLNLLLASGAGLIDCLGARLIGWRRAS
jgi:hypothetical protein